ncbi:MAG: hypothetical protein AMXMBFR7_31250 [Planctomycetota bacterium]
MTGMRRQGKHGMGGILALLGVLIACAAPAAFAQREEQLLVSSEIEGRKVVLPPGLALELEWYSPVVDASKAGLIVRGWVDEEFVLLETDKLNLICVNRKDGTENWRLVLEQPLRYQPEVTRNNVIVNVNNFLVAVEKRTGEVRWRLLPKFVMSTPPLVFDPPAYKAEYTREWQNMESVYTGAWEGRIHGMSVRGRLEQYSPSLAAPQFDIYYNWHKTHVTRGIISTPLKLYDDAIYYSADDSQVYAVTRDGEVRTPYKLQGAPCTNLAVDSLNVYVGARDYYFYALDRLTLQKKWAYPSGGLMQGNIYADEPVKESFVYVPTVADGIHALSVQRATGGGQSSLVTPESYQLAWKAPGTHGVVSASEKVVYLGKNPTKDFAGYTTLVAVDKASGKVLWETESAKKEGARFYIEFHNAWRRDDQQMRIFAVTADNRLLSFREKRALYGPMAEKVEKTAAPAAPEKK